MKVPFVDLAIQYEAYAAELQAAIQDVLRSCEFILGKDVEIFETEFARFCGVKHCVGVGSGTEALHLALRALSVGPGDEVITVANTYVATVLAIIHVGATPILVDIDPDSYNIDPNRIERVITHRTRAIIPVHLYGQPADMDPIREIAERYGIRIIEDASQAHGAEYNNRRCGSLGDVGCFSFYPGKNLGAYGDAGAAVTNNPAVADRLKMLRNYGQRVKYEHEVKGFNSRLDTLQAAVLKVKLRHLEKWTTARRDHARRYTELLEELEIGLPRSMPDSKHVYHIYAIRTNNRDALQRHLASLEISTVIHYPTPIHLQTAYTDLGYKPGDFPVTEQHAAKVLSLPMFPELTDAQLQFVAQAIRGFLSP